MKKVWAVLAICAVLLSGCSGKQRDFRNARWGDSPSKVAKSEDIKPTFTTDDLIMYETVIDDIDAEIYYQFDDNKLIEAQIQFRITGTQEHVLMDFVDHYLIFKDALIALYGQPVQDDYRVWLLSEHEIPLYEQDPINQLMYYQRMEFKLEWITKDTYASLTLNYRDLQENYIYYACDIALYESGGATIHG